LRRGFLRIARDEPDRCVVIDGAREAEAVAADVFQAVASRLLAKAE
jgi:dTMP kinase